MVFNYTGIELNTSERILLLQLNYGPPSIMIKPGRLIMMYLSIPSVPPQIVSWVHKYASNNFWKVEGLCDKDDLIQEGYYAIAYCLNKYGTELNPPHLMRLVQITFNCKIIDIAKKRTKLAETQSIPGIVLDDEPDISSDLDRLIAEAPEVVRRALLYLVNDHQCRMRDNYPTGPGGKETTSSRLSSLLCIDTDNYLMDKIRSYLRGN